MELRRRTWIAAMKLAVVISAIAALGAIVLSAAGDVPQAAIVLPVIVIAFTASWVTTGRVDRTESPVLVPATRERITSPSN